MLNIAATLLILAVVVGLIALSTWLFVERLRAGDRIPRSFGRWLLDVLDTISGVG